jgi:hypothetical protein
MDPYSTAKPLLGSLPQWVADPQEQRRLASYWLYEAIYWTVPDTFKLVSRGAEDKPIYVPSGRTIVETLHRYLANGLSVIPDPMFGTPNDQLLAQQVWTDLARRERFYSKFNANKRHGIMRGDWVFHFYADPARLPGSKISIFAVDPASCFPIYNPENIDEIIGWHIAEQFLDNEGKEKIRRLTYRKTTGTGGPSPITVEDAIFELDDWGGPAMNQDAKPLEVKKPLMTLPAPIDQLPVYLITNFDTPGMIWGSSEMRGLERIMAAVNQTISDEELALAMEGLGVYWTDAGAPVNEDGEEIDWDLGPGRVVEVPEGKTFNRLSGVSSVAPNQEHLKYLHQVLDEVVGLTPIAKGHVDVSVAESGISRMIEMYPLLARVAEKETTITDVLTNMLYDLAKWYVGYEGGAFNSLVDVTRWIPQYGPKLPPNAEKELDQLVVAAKEKIIPYSYVRTRMRNMGFTDMPPEAEIEATIIAESTARAQVAQDAFGARAEGEMGGEPADDE